MHKKHHSTLKSMKIDRRREPRDWSVYILRCGDGSLYTGIAKDVAGRLIQHAAGRGANYTRMRLPVALAYREGGYTHSQALIRESQIKSLPRLKKRGLFLS